MKTEMISEAIRCIELIIIDQMPNVLGFDVDLNTILELEKIKLGIDRPSDYYKNIIETLGDGRYSHYRFEGVF